MIHYHGTPINPESDAALVLRGRHAMISFADPRQLSLATEICQSFVLDNGAYSLWNSGKKTNWADYYSFVEEHLRNPSLDWALIPDVIGGDEVQNDALLKEWPFGKHAGVPVWHLHESLSRLGWLCFEFPRVALGSSAQYSRIGTLRWYSRMAEAMKTCCDSLGRPITKLHGLRMLNPDVFQRFPFSSADSTNVTRTMSSEKHWKSAYAPRTNAARGIVIAERIESFQSPATWTEHEIQQELLA